MLEEFPIISVARPNCLNFSHFGPTITLGATIGMSRLNTRTNWNREPHVGSRKRNRSANVYGGLLFRLAKLI